MKKRKTYITPDTSIQTQSAGSELLALSSSGPSANYVSNPDIGDDGTDEIGTESRRSSDGYWTE